MRLRDTDIWKHHMSRMDEELRLRARRSVYVHAIAILSVSALIGMIFWLLD